MYVCDAIDGARQFKDPQDQGFEDAPEQQQSLWKANAILRS
jgi:hypothetical protein